MCPSTYGKLLPPIWKSFSTGGSLLVFFSRRQKVKFGGPLEWPLGIAVKGVMGKHGTDQNCPRKAQPKYPYPRYIHCITPTACTYFVQSQELNRCLVKVEVIQPCSTVSHMKIAAWVLFATAVTITNWSGSLGVWAYTRVNTLIGTLGSIHVPPGHKHPPLLTARSEISLGGYGTLTLVV